MASDLFHMTASSIQQNGQVLPIKGTSRAHLRTLYTYVEEDRSEHLLITNGVLSSRPDTFILVFLNSHKSHFIGDENSGRNK